MPLTGEDIEKLASRKGVSRVPVENFLSTLGQEGAAGRAGALRNLYSDAISYHWTDATVKAIESGINKFFKRRRSMSKRVANIVLNTMAGTLIIGFVCLIAAVTVYVMPPWTLHDIDDSGILFSLAIVQILAMVVVIYLALR